MRLTDELWAQLASKLIDIVGDEWVVTGKHGLLDYLVDETAQTVRPEPAESLILVKPTSARETSEILKLANMFETPVFPRGGGTGLVGGAVPTEDGIILSLERMDNVVEVDRENLMITVEAGVTLEKLIETAEAAGLTFPPHPGDEAAQVGGLVACNAGGVRAVRWGVMRNFVLGLEVVLPTGEILELGGKILKDVAGYSLMHLIIGSQGTLGIITRVVLRLYPKFKEAATLVIPFNNRHEALAVVPRILQAGITPLAVEYFERGLMAETAKQLGIEWPVKRGNASLMIILTGKSEEEVYRDADNIDELAKQHNAIDTLVIRNRRKQASILKIRSGIYLTLKPYVMDVLDVAVPPASMVNLMETLDTIAEKHGMRVPTVGHVGDGNMHPHILLESSGGVAAEDLDEVKREIYDAAVSLGGIITAEHGVGKIRVKDLHRYQHKKTIEITENIKRIFDPKNILNPGVIVQKSKPA